MPVVAVGFAVALDIGAVGALAAGTLTTMAAITAIGATVGAVGAVTHNKTLSMVGMGLGIVGAIGTLASGAGVFDNVTDLFKPSGAGPGGASIFDTPGVYDAAAGGPINAAGFTAAGADIASATGALDQAVAVNPAGAINATSAAGGNAAALETAGQTGGPLTQVLSPGADVTGSAAGAAAGGAASETPSFFSTPGLYDAAAGGPIGPNGLAAPASGILNWAKNNPLLSYGILQAGGSFVSGLTNPLSPAQIEAMNAQADVNRATATLLQRQTANQNTPLPTVTGRTAPTTAGLINAKPASAPLITGAPNTGAAPLLSTGTTG